MPRAARPGGLFHPQKGGLLCGSPCGGDGGSFRLSERARRTLVALAEHPMESLAGWAMDRYPGAEVSRAIERFLTSHLERFEGLRAQRVGEAMVRYAAGRDETPRDGIGLSAAPQTFQEILLRLEQFWSDQGCALLQPYAGEVGAGTFNPATFFRVLGPELEGRVRRALAAPQGRRYGENPNRLQNFYQYQVALKPAPADVLDLYLQSLRHIGIDLSRHDVRFVEDDWESPTLGAWGLGWEVWLDGQEITQFTYFQQSGGYDLEPVTAEITYGIERIACYLQGVERIMDLQWSRSIAGTISSSRPRSSGAGSTSRSPIRRSSSSSSRSTSGRRCGSSRRGSCCRATTTS